MTDSIRLVFMGSPDFALPILEVLAKQYNVVGVITQPDRPAGRGRIMTPPPVKLLADQLGISTIQPEKIRLPEPMAIVQTWAPNLIVVAAFGQILRQAVLDLPEYGCINVHASLLPRWRGAAPIQAAIAAGDAQTGVTIMKMDAGVDTGAMLSQRALPIDDTDNAETLSTRLAKIGADLLKETLPGYLDGSIQPHPQPEEGMTYARMLDKKDGYLDFKSSAVSLERLVRANYPWPGTQFFLNGEPYKVIGAGVVPETALQPGVLGSDRGWPVIGCSQGGLMLKTIQPAGKKPMPGDVFLRGTHAWKGLTVDIQEPLA
ncbi:MAG TPA: methionyl-tRNA formyltransferase [Longilinea sp.]|nr:methionyl-tRNA formyltransferase [Longilinea sp.]